MKKGNNNLVSSVDVVTAFRDIPYFILNKELEQGFYENTVAEFARIKEYYKVYEKGADFATEGSSGDYVPSQIRYKLTRTLIDKEARFMFGETPDFVVNDMGDESENEQLKKQIELRQTIIDKVFGSEGNNISKMLLQAAKDCFIAKRVACMVDMNEEDGIRVVFFKSLQFIFETDYDNPNKLIKFVSFVNVRKSSKLAETRILTKRYALEMVGNEEKCFVQELIYDGRGNLIEEVLPYSETEYAYIPVVVITNGGLIGNTLGESEVEELQDSESGYSKLANADIDSERKGMNPIRYTVDMNPETTKSLPSGAGAYWDLVHDMNIDNPSPQVGTLAPDMNHTEPVKTTLERLKNSMYSELDIPNIDLDTMTGTITSGKALKAIYWPLTIRCNEKLKTWIPALKLIMKAVLDGALLYPNITREKYLNESLTPIEFECNIEINYPLPEDEQEEKTLDLQEVDYKTMSRKSYMKKWRQLTDKEVDEELEQIAYEVNLIENNGIMPQNGNYNNNLTDNGVEEENLI